MQTDITLAYLRKTRQLFLGMMDDLSLGQLNQIPEGFNNNIIWNLGHIAVSTPGLCYIRSQVKPETELPFPGRFGKGSRPEVEATAEEVEEIKKFLVSSLDQIETDIHAGVFTELFPFATDTYQIPMDSIENTLNCCLAHENLHLGIAKAQKAVILNAGKVKKEQSESKISLN
ncbi:DinB family protein [Arachidicoccus terrestris]|uniref:DinB family protein n=1 Tax=Arachidicoccus terrestris TaxID=2875539 RepID=UPI001CC4959A|nr:DinB family protein [Arachidicoccus terrestris]UAY54987.1 DinB family protein [Arachidicoccus terrestris]